VIIAVRPAIKNLSVSAILLGILGGLIGVAAGLFLGFALGSGLAAAFHVSTFEGGAGYFAGLIALLVTLIVTPAAILLVLYWRGVRSIWLFLGLVIVCISMAAIGASGFGVWYAAQPHVLNINGPTPLLEFEVKPPTGQSLDSLAKVEPELDTDRNTMPGYWHTDAPENSGVRAGYVELYFRTSKRLFVLKFPGGTDRLFQLHLPANPMQPKYRAWSEWKNPDFVAKAGEQPSRPSGGSDYQIRYKLDYQDR
jgi:energy-coupling factor transporter transmembrane protein EcfT